MKHVLVHVIFHVII